MAVAEDQVKCLVKKEPKIFRATKSIHTIPSYIEEDPKLKHAIEVLPKAYNFELPKSIWRLLQAKAKHVVLQFPEGLLIYSMTIADILENWTGVDVTILGDVTYGACCVDDFTARAVGADFMIHYGHSCLVPIDQTEFIPCLYVFVDIKFDITHLLETIQAAFLKSQPLALVSIIQFVSSLQRVATKLKENGYDVTVPQSHPLSPGEVLGCTSIPVADGCTIVCLGDGRFHLESIMMSNPDTPTYLYNPYSKLLTHEYYEQSKMKLMRKKEINKASSEIHWGIILGTLGRQGNTKVLQNLQKQLKAAGKDYVVVLMSEIFPEKLSSMSNIGAWVQIACPRLSIDWGASFPSPLLNPYEATVALKNAEWDAVKYPMDFYANDSLGEWTPNHKPKCPCGRKRTTGCKGPRCPSKKNI